MRSPVPGDGPAGGEACRWDCREHLACLMARVVDDLPAHYFDCDRFQTYNYGLRQGACDCKATEDVRSILVALSAALAVDPADHATTSRDYGRGFADAIRRVQEAAELPAPTSEVAPAVQKDRGD